MPNKKQAAITPEMIGAGIGATGAGLAAYLLSKKNKARNTLLAILGGGLAGSAGGAGYRAYGQSRGVDRWADEGGVFARPDDVAKVRSTILPQFLRNTATLGLDQPTIDGLEEQGSDDADRWNSASAEYLRR